MHKIIILFFFTILLTACDSNILDPSSGYTSWEITLNYDTHYKVVIENNYNVKVRTLVDKLLIAGRWTIYWDHTSDDGVQVPEGIYIIKHYFDNTLNGQYKILIRNK
jgi:hypothetical protein